MPTDAEKTPNINRLIHEPARFMIMAHLYVVESADFLFLQHQMEMTPGNLSAHLRKLEDAEYVEVVKEFVDRKPHTALKLTKKGRDVFREYQTTMKRVLDNLPKGPEVDP
ncbi:MAG: winged helix-turn-helix domain-containing protein [Candidatus Bathyarchaeia archaeon]